MKVEPIIYFFTELINVIRTITAKLNMKGVELDAETRINFDWFWNAYSADMLDDVLANRNIHKYSLFLLT